MQVTMIGLDLAKNVFQVHGVDAHERPVLRKRLSRSKVAEFFARLPPCRVGMEACPGRIGGRGNCSNSATTSS